MDQKQPDVKEMLDMIKVKKSQSSTTSRVKFIDQMTKNSSSEIEVKILDYLFEKSATISKGKIEDISNGISGYHNTSDDENVVEDEDDGSKQISSSSISTKSRRIAK